MKLQTILREGLIHSVTRAVILRKLQRQLRVFMFEDPPDEPGMGLTVRLRLKPNAQRTDYEHDIGVINRMLPTVGWYVATSFVRTQTNGQWVNKLAPLNSNTTILVISIEPKYDVPFTTLPALLYHWAPRRVRNKILRQGLVPRSKSRLAHHPERVYASVTLSDAIDIEDELQNTDIGNHPTQIDNGYDLYIIDTEKLLPDTKFYVDSNFMYDDVTPSGIYTTSNIPPSALRLYHEN